MIDFNYTAPELLPFRIQEVLDAPNEPHRIGGVVYVPEGGGECELTIEPWESDSTKFDAYCGNCGYPMGDGELKPWKYCPECGWKAVKR